MFQTAKTKGRSRHERHLEKISDIFKTSTEVLAKITGSKYIQIEILIFTLPTLRLLISVIIRYKNDNTQIS